MFCRGLFSIGTAKDLSDEDQSYEDYIDEVENMRHREKDSDEIETKAILAHLGLPDYEYVDAQSYDHLLPQHLTYGEEQTVKLHNAKRMSCETRCCSPVRAFVRVSRPCKITGGSFIVLLSLFSGSVCQCGELARGQISAE